MTLASLLPRSALCKQSSTNSLIWSIAEAQYTADAAADSVANDAADTLPCVASVSNLFTFPLSWCTSTCVHSVLKPAVTLQLLDY